MSACGGVMSKRRRYSAAYKFKVALAAARGDKTLCQQRLLDSTCKCNRRISKEHLVRRSEAKAFSGAQVQLETRASDPTPTPRPACPKLLFAPPLRCQMWVKTRAPEVLPYGGCLTQYQNTGQSSRNSANSRGSSVSTPGPLAINIQPSSQSCM